MDYQIKEVQRNCRYVEEDCEDAIQIAKLRLAELEEEKKRSYLYAGMDGTISALHSFQLRYYIFNFHSLYQTADALKISIASAPKEYLLNHIVFHFYLNVAAASTLRFISNLHFYSSSAGFMFV